MTADLGLLFSHVRVAVLCLLALPPVDLALAQDGQDVDGWRAAKWGMTEEQVLASIGEARRLEAAVRFTDTVVATLTIPHYEIESLSYRVLFGFGLDGLAVVQLEPVDNTTPGALHSAAFGSLDRLLTEKYGTPTAAKDESPTASSSRLRARTWRLPGTMIHLEYFWSAGFGTLQAFDSLLLSYRAPTKDAGKL